MTLNSVWLVDDDAIYRFAISKTIEKLGLNRPVLTFSDGEEAMTVLRLNVDKSDDLPDIVLLDINMPNMDGWQFLEEYDRLSREIKKDIKIYMVSSSVSGLDISKARSNPYVRDYISKPLSREQLASILELAS